MKSMKNRKKIYFSIFFSARLWPHKGHSSCKFFLQKKVFFPPFCKYFDGFGLMCFRLGQFRWPYRLPWPYYITYYIHFLSQKFLIDAPLLETRYEKWSIKNCRKLHHLTWQSTCLGLIWNPYLDRFHIDTPDTICSAHVVCKANCTWKHKKYNSTLR